MRTTYQSRAFGTSGPPAGFGCLPFPDVSAPIRPYGSSPSSAAAVVFPCCAAHLGLGTFLLRPRVHPDPWRVGDSCSGSPLACVCTRKGEALPGYWAVLLSRAVVSDLAERAAVLPITDGDAATFRTTESLGARKPYVSKLYSHGPRLCIPTHRPMASLPFGARLATGPPGLALAGRVSHPLDDFSEFHELPHVFIPFRPALPGRTGRGRVSARRVSRLACACACASRGPRSARPRPTLSCRLPPTNSLTQPASR